MHFHEQAIPSGGDDGSSFDERSDRPVGSRRRARCPHARSDSASRSMRRPCRRRVGGDHRERHASSPDHHIRQSLSHIIKKREPVASGRWQMLVKPPDCEAFFQRIVRQNRRRRLCCRAECIEFSLDLASHVLILKPPEGHPKWPLRRTESRRQSSYYGFKLLNRHGRQFRYTRLTIVIECHFFKAEDAHVTAQINNALSRSVVISGYKHSTRIPIVRRHHPFRLGHFMALKI